MVGARLRQRSGQRGEYGPEGVDGGWVLDGQKTWTTRGAFCSHMFGLFRSDPESERHRGLTYLLVPLDTPGVTGRAFGRLDGGEGFAEIFFDDVFLAEDSVPGGVVLGEPGQAWSVIMSAAGAERGLLRAPGRFLATARRLRDLNRQSDRRAGRQTPGAAGIERRIAAAWMKAEAFRLHSYQTVSALSDGAALGAVSSVMKVWWSELDIELHEIAMDLLGSEAEVEGDWSRGWQFSLAGPICAGTNEIQRNIIAERILGLPR